MSSTTWFITGASSGFGLSFARYALSKGYNVVATARDPAKLAALQAEVPAQVLTTALDVNDKASIAAAVEAAKARFGRIDVLINNAGYGIVGAVEETPDTELRALMETNFFGAVAVTQAVLPLLRRQGSGTIVNISSLGGQLSYGGYGAYSASKFALEGLSEALALELAPFGVKVMIVEPGAFRTGFAGNALRHMPVLPPYEEGLKPVRDFTTGMHETQPGDPLKAAAAIDMALRAEKTPLRLQLGEDSVTAVRSHAEALLADLAAWEKVGLDTRIDG
ncbi:short-chain dehydrogenase/reductase [Labrys miyagiensis]|uniref:Short-chain dehydrogenase/reductase n=1 Tax=Labrys miyagiensis TaxID=346912 RepID=A0ABQ6CMA9_9HYPH|nr:oxidoreductase [Labrys miyagiensis]GLS21433.1 short-chain dehydrogenase/reductase [Labrys miyagiensis]